MTGPVIMILVGFGIILLSKIGRENELDIFLFVLGLWFLFMGTMMSIGDKL